MIRWPAAAALEALENQARVRYQDLHWAMAQKLCLVAIARYVIILLINLFHLLF